MKKSFLFAAVAMVAIASCNKEEVAPVEQNEAVVGDVSITAYAPGDEMTKTVVDGATVKWATGDHIAIFDDSNAVHDFTLSSGAGTTAGVFTGTIGTSSGFAVYPYTANAAFDGSEFTLDYADTYTYDAVKVPLIGIEDGGNPGKYAFDNIGGAFKIQYTNVPAGATKFVFTSTSNITGTGLYDLTDFVLASNEGKVVTVTDLPSSSTLTFIIPVPAGSYSFDIKLLDSSDNVIPASAKTVSSAKTVDAGHLVPMKAIDLKAAKDATLWSEDFEACSADDQPDESTSTVFGGGTATYAYNGTYSKVYTSGVLGSTELLIAKSTRSETWVVSNIPTGSWDSLTLTYKANQNIAVESSDVTVGDATIEAGTYTRVITVADGRATFSLTFSMKTDSNARIDDIQLTAGAPTPTIAVTTAVASSISSTGATLNGSITLKNGAVLGTVTAAGFYYKKTASLGDYSKVTVTTPLGSTNFSKEITGLDTEEYTYYAFATYDSGDEVTGSTKTFTPSSTPSGADPDANGICFNLTSYSSLPTGWTCSGVTTNASYFIVDEEGSMISPDYNLSDYDSATVNVSIRNYGTGTNSAIATLYISYDGGSSWSESTNWTATGSNSAKTYNLKGALTANVAIKIANTASDAKDLRVFSFKLQGAKD